MGHLASLNAEFSAQWARTLEGGKVGWLFGCLVGWYIDFMYTGTEGNSFMSAGQWDSSL